jgi:hypothetical protein
MMTITEQQEEFIWLAHAGCKTFAEIESILGLSRATLSLWEEICGPYAR